MNNWQRQLENWGRKAAVALILGLSLGALSACEGLLDVDIPAQLQDEDLDDPNTAETQVGSIIALFECAYSAYAWQILGNEDVSETITGVASGSHRYFANAAVFDGDCDSDSEDNDWYQQIQSSRALAFQLYDKMQNVWTVEQVPDREEFSAVASIYAALNLDHLGQLFCEMALEAGPLMTPDETLVEAEAWATRALDHISGMDGGDFEMPFGVARGDDTDTGARQMAHGLRARIRFARGETDGALADIAQVDQGFVAYVTREAGPTRRNKVYNTSTAVAMAAMLGQNTWWDGPPFKGQAWPNPIPFTGYIFLGIDSDDGRAVNPDGTPVRWAEEERPVDDNGNPLDPIPLGNGAVPDTRVPHFMKTTSGGGLREVPDKYKSEDDDIPVVNWKELWLIRATIEGGQTAIDLVNELRADADLPLVTYADPGNAEEIRHMITEEWRRALWLEGRYYPYKIRNTDLLWFPRAVGSTPAQGFGYDGAVRLHMPNSEFSLNENLTLEDRGTGCDPDERPVNLT